MSGYEKTLPASGRVAAATFENDQPDHSSLEDPTQVFEMLHPLGRGSYGSVHKALFKDNGEIVAVKIIPLTEADEMSSIQREIAMLRDCNHPNIVKYYGSWRAPDALWIAMEYCAGGSVSDIMHALDAPLEEAVISYICRETLAGLTYLHAQGRVHRDIKCGNILLTEAGHVKLADFGVAAQLTSTLSKRNTFIGTPHWMAPEVIQASHYDGKVDIWALGISSIEMAEMYPPRWRVNPNRVIFMVVRDPPPRLGEKERWTLAFQDFIAQCLNKEPRARPAAGYLQQHRFIARDQAEAMRKLLPAIQRARAQYDAAAAEAAAAAHVATLSDDGYFSWHQAPPMMGVGSTIVGPGAAAMAAQQQQRPSSGAASATVVERPPRPSSSHNNHHQSNFDGTVVMHNEPSSYVSPLQGFEGADTVVMSPASQPSAADTMVRRPLPPPPPAAAAALSPGGGAPTPSAQPSAARPSSALASSSLAPEPSVDYLAAVQSASAGAPDLELSPPPRSSEHLEGQRFGGPIGNAYGAGGAGVSHQQPSPYGGHPGGGGVGPKSEAARLIERLFNLHSSGAVVPLPFLQATDLAPLALLGLESCPEIGSRNRSRSSGSVGSSVLDWQAALQSVLEDAAGPGETSSHHTKAQQQDHQQGGDNTVTGGGGAHGNRAGALPPALVARVTSSPMLLNVATALARHRAALEEGKAAGVPARAQEATKRRAEALSDTLRTILCL